MKYYSCTDTGKTLAKRSMENNDELRMLRYIRENKVVSDDALDVVGGRYLVRSLVRRKLVREVA